MALFENFPYTNFHDMNMDWLLKKVKELGAQVAAFETLLENGPVADVKTQVNGAYATIKDSDGIALLPGASATTAGVVTMDVDDDIVTLGGAASTVEVPVLTDGVLSVDQIPTNALANATRAGSVLLNANPGVDGVAKIVGADGEIAFPKLTDNKLNDSLLPDSGVTAGTFGTTPAWTAGNYQPLTQIAVDAAGRVTSATAVTMPIIRSGYSTITAGNTTNSVLFNSTSAPWYNNSFWIDAQVFASSGSGTSQTLTALTKGVDYNLILHPTYAEVVLTSTRTEPVYVKWFGNYGNGGH